MQLIPDTLRKRLLKNGAEVTENDDHIPLVKLDKPDTGETWLISELSPKEPDFAFGLIHPRSRSPCLAYFSLPHARHAETAPWLDVRLDRTFSAEFPISVYAHAARKAGHIVTDHASLIEAAAELQQQEHERQRKFGTT